MSNIARHIEGDMRPNGSRPLRHLSDLLTPLLTSELPDLETFGNTNLGANKLVHLLASCQGLGDEPKLRSFESLRDLPVAYFNPARNEPEALCGDCISLITSHQTIKAYLWAGQREYGSPGRQLRALWFSASVLSEAQDLERRACGKELLPRARMAMQVLRSSSRMYGWLSQLHKNAQANPQAWAVAELGAIIHRETMRSDFPEDQPDGGLGVGLALLAIPESPHVLSKLWQRVEARKIYDKARKAGRRRELRELLEASSPDVARKGAIGSAWCLVFLPHIPEVPLAAAYLRHSVRIEHQFLISGFAVMPEALALALASGRRRFPVVETELPRDSTSSGSERANYPADRITVVPLGRVRPESINLAVHAQTLDMTMYLWNSFAATQGLTPGTLEWARLGQDALDVARSLFG